MAEVHLFDVDYTLLKKSTGYYFILECLSRHLLRWHHIGKLPLELLKYKLGLLTGDFIERAVSPLGGIRREVLEETALDCFQKRLLPKLYPFAEALVKKQREAGKITALASSSLEVILSPLREYLGVEEAGVCSYLEFAGEKATGRLAGKAPFGEEKLLAVKEWCASRSFSPEEVTFYTDSYTDLPLLEWVGHPVAVNPDRFLARRARERGWPTLP